MFWAQCFIFQIGIRFCPGFSRLYCITDLQSFYRLLSVAESNATFYEDRHEWTCLKCRSVCTLPRFSICLNTIHRPKSVQFLNRISHWIIKFPNASLASQLEYRISTACLINCPGPFGCWCKIWPLFFRIDLKMYITLNNVQHLQAFTHF